MGCALRGTTIHRHSYRFRIHTYTKDISRLVQERCNSIANPLIYGCLHKCMHLFVSRLSHYQANGLVPFCQRDIIQTNADLISEGL